MGKAIAGARSTPEPFFRFALTLLRDPAIVRSAYVRQLLQEALAELAQNWEGKRNDPFVAWRNGWMSPRHLARQAEAEKRDLGRAQQLAQLAISGFQQGRATLGPAPWLDWELASCLAVLANLQRAKVPALAADTWRKCRDLRSGSAHVLNLDESYAIHASAQRTEALAAAAQWPECQAELNQLMVTTTRAVDSVSDLNGVGNFQVMLNLVASLFAPLGNDAVSRWVVVQCRKVEGKARKFPDYYAVIGVKLESERKAIIDVVD
jgi:hypothetical protein